MAKMSMKMFEKSKADMKKDAKKGMPKEGSKKEEMMDRKAIFAKKGGIVKKGKK